MVIISNLFQLDFSMAQFSTQPNRASVTTPLTLPKDGTVFVFSGWGNAGKTNTIGRALLGLNEDVAKVAVIISERSEASVAIDMNRLPEGFEKVGLKGCVCCSQLSEVLASIASFQEKGRVHTFIEQGHLSVASDLRSGLLHAGHRPIVIFLFNPAQYVKEYQCVQFSGIRGADIVVLTHCQGSPDLIERGRKIVAAATGDLKQKPSVLVDSDPLGEFSPELWVRILEASSSPAKRGGKTWFSNLFGGSSATPDTHTEELGRLRKRFSEESFVPYVSSPDELVQKLVELRTSGALQIERVKGFLEGGVDVNIEWIPGQNRYKLSCTAAPEGIAPVVAVRTLQGPLRPHFPKIVSSFATQDVNPAFIDTVATAYPAANDIVAEIRAGTPPLAFEPDRVLTDLVNCRYSMNAIRSSQPERFNEMCEAIIKLQDAALSARLDLLQGISEHGRNTQEEAVAAFNAYYFLLAQFSNENLQPFQGYLNRVNKHPLSMTLQGELGDRFVTSAQSMSKIRFEGRRDLTRSEVQDLSATLHGAKRDGRISQEALVSLVSHWFSPKFGDTDLKAQKDLLQSLIGN